MAMGYLPPLRQKGGYEKERAALFLAVERGSELVIDVNVLRVL